MAKITIKAKFGITPNHVLNDPKMSFKAKWLYGYIQSKPENWDFSGDKIALDSTDGRNAVYSWLKELEEIGYLHRIKSKNTKWQWEIEYILNEYPEIASIVENQHWEETDETTADFPQADFPQTGNRQTIKERPSKKDLVKKNKDIKETIKKIEKVEMEIVEISKDTFPILSEKLKEFFEFRKAKRKPILKESLPSFIKNLEKLSGGVENVAVEILDQSIANGWQGIFELKGHNPTGNNFTSFTWQKVWIAKL